MSNVVTRIWCLLFDLRCGYIICTYIHVSDSALY